MKGGAIARLRPVALTADCKIPSLLNECMSFCLSILDRLTYASILTFIL